MKSSQTEYPHVSVLKEEFLETYADQNIEVFFDGTLGAGGHAEALLEAHPEIKTYVGCDQDPSALEIAKKRLEPWKDKVKFVHANFSELGEILEELEIEAVDGFFLTWECHLCSSIKKREALV